MALPTPHTSAAAVITKHRFTQQEFNWDERNDDTTLNELVATAIADAQIQVYQIVGAENYSSTRDIVLAAVKLSEFDIACALMLRNRAAILASRPEESPPREEIELTLLMDLIRETEARANARLVPYQTSEIAETVSGAGFAFGATGVDETSQDVTGGGYDHTDFGSLPS